MKVRVLHWWTTKLWLLNHWYKGRPQLEIVDLHSWSSDAWRYSLNSWGYEIPECPSLTFASSIFTDSSLVLRLLSSLCFFLLRWKVRSISRSGSYANGLRTKGKIALQTHSRHYQSNKNWKGIKRKQKHLVTFTRITRYLEKLIPGNGTKTWSPARLRVL